MVETCVFFSSSPLVWLMCVYMKIWIYIIVLKKIWALNVSFLSVFVTAQVFLDCVVVLPTLIYGNFYRSLFCQDKHISFDCNLFVTWRKKRSIHRLPLYIKLYDILRVNDCRFYNINTTGWLHCVTATYYYYENYIESSVLY